MALNNFNVGRPTAIPENGRLRFSRTKRHWSLHFIPKRDIVARIQEEEPDYTAPANGILLAEADPDEGWLNIWPLNTTRLGDYPFRPKYRRPRLIRVEGMTDLQSNTVYDVVEVLSKLPQGFVRSPLAGLGLDLELRAIIDTFNEHDVDVLIVRSGRRDGLPFIDEKKCLTIAKVQFDEIRRAIRRVHEKSLDIAGEEKDRIAYPFPLTAAF